MPHVANTHENPPLLSTLPARLDALPWSRWHTRVVAALGITWMLDGLEVTVVGSIGPVLQRTETLGLSAAQIGWAGSAYVGGAVLGALFFGRLADRLGRKPLFLATLSVYLVATLLTALTFDFRSFALCRLLTGFGIGGEYAAINSAIDELIPGARARLRRPRDQRQLLDRRGGGRGVEHRAARARPVRARRRLAARVRVRQRAHDRDPARAPPPAREPALAHDARQDRGSGGDRAARSRTEVARDRGPLPPPAGTHSRCAVRGARVVERDPAAHGVALPTRARC